MTAERLFLEIGNVDEKYFTRAMKYRSSWVKRGPVKGLLAAAVLIFLLTVGISVSAETILYYRAVDYLTEMNIDISQMTRSEIKERYREEIAKDPYTQRNELESEMQGMGTAEGTETASYEFVYALLSDGTYMIQRIKGTVPEELVISDVTPEGAPVTRIDEKAFSNQKDLKRVRVSAGIRILGESSFANCASLEVVMLEGVRTVGKYAFLGCESLREIFLGNELGTIESHAFSGTSLRVLILPKSLRYLREFALEGCHSEMTVCYEGSEEEWEAYGFRRACQTLNLIYQFNYGSQTTEGLTFIQQEDGTAWVRAIPGYWSESLLIPKVSPEGWTVTGIEPSAFRGNEFLKEIVIPKTVTVIGEYAFEGCSALASIVIPDTVKTLGSSVFQNCTDLKEVSLPKGLERIPTDMFRGCTSLEKFIVLDGVTTIGHSAFKGCTALKQIELPQSLQIIESNAFENCPSMVWSENGLPDHLIYIGEAAIDPSFQLPTMTFEHPGTGKPPKIYDENGNLMSFTYEMYVGKYLIAVVTTEEYTVREGTYLIAAGGLTTLYGAPSFTIPTDVKIVCGDWLFRGAIYHPFTVYYQGTQAQWDQIRLILFNGTEEEQQVTWKLVFLAD